MKVLLPLSFLLIFLIASFGIAFREVVIIGLIFSLLQLAIFYFQFKKLSWPKNFKLYLLSLIPLAIGLFWSVDKVNSLNYLALFISGGVFWLLSYNIGERMRLTKILPILGLILAGLYFIQDKWGLWRHDWLGLISPATVDHDHIGDLWAIILIMQLPNLFRKEKFLINLLLTGLGGYLLVVSQSRSAVMALALGLIYFWWRKKELRFNFKNVLPLILLAGVFLFFGLSKSAFFNRPYYLQAVLGLARYPFGVGLGNFEIISKAFPLDNWGLGGFSMVTHNLILEMLSAVGVLSAPFVYFLYKVLKEVVNSRNHLTSALLVGLSVNFLFDFTYFVPVLLWLWFCLLGTSNLKSNEGGIH